MLKVGRSQSFLVAAVLSAALTPCVPAAEPTSPELQAMQAELQQLRTEVQQLRQQVNAKDSDAADATAAAVIRDADQRSSLTDFTAGYKDGKFILQSADGNFVLHPFFHLQFRNVTTFHDDAKGEGRDDTDNGFELRRMKFGFDGNLYTPDLTYEFVWGTERKTGTPSLDGSCSSFCDVRR